MLAYQEGLYGVSGKMWLLRRFERTYCIYHHTRFQEITEPSNLCNANLVLLWQVNQDGENLKSGSCQDCPLFKLMMSPQGQGQSSAKQRYPTLHLINPCGTVRPLYRTGVSLYLEKAFYIFNQQI